MTPYQKILALQTNVQKQIADGRLQKAIETQLAALKLAQSTNRPKLIAILYQYLGQILEQKGDIQKTVYAYESAFKALNEEDHQLDKTISRLRKVSKSFQQDQRIDIPDVFSPEMETSLDLALKSEDLNIKLLINIGNSYFHQPQIIPALNAYQQVLLQQNIESYPLLKAQTLIKIGEIFRQQKKASEAQKNIKSALKILDTVGIESDKRFAFALQARLLFQAQKIQQAIPFYQKALNLFQQSKDIKNEGKLLAQMGQLYLGIPDFKLAKNAYSKALKCAELSNFQDLEWHVHWGLGCCYRASKNWDKAVEYFEKSQKQILVRQDQIHTDEGKVAFLESVQDVFNRLIEAYLQIGTQSAIQKALEVAENARGQSLSDLMQNRSRIRALDRQKKTKNPIIPPPQSSGHFAQQMSLGTSIAPPNPFPDVESFQHLSNTFKPVDPMDMVRQEASGIFSESYANSPPPTPPIIDSHSKPSLLKREVGKRHFLFFFKLYDQLIVWLKKSDGKIVFHQIDMNANQLAQKVELLRTSLMQDAQNRGIDISRGIKIADKNKQFRAVISRKSTSNSSDFKTISKQLYQALLAPFQTELAGNVKTLVLVPHDFLWLLPFAGLIDQTDTYLGQQYNLVYTPSIKALTQIDNEAPYSELQNAKALIIGNPTMSQADERYRFNPLKGAEKEALALSKLFKVQPLIQAAATQVAVEKSAASTNILHLATHGIADENNPLESFIVLADSFHEDGSLNKDGLLKAREIMNWSLPCELVNLSACQTALGKVSGEGIIGLSRAFLVAGSRSVLVSLWNISDEATAAFMILFYKYYLAQGNKAVALQKTMQDIQKSQKYAHPVFWSAFTLVGAEE